MFIQFTFNIPGVTEGSRAFSLSAASIKALHLDVGTGLIQQTPEGSLLRFSALLGSNSRVTAICYDALQRFLDAMQSERLMPGIDGEREMIWLRDGIRYRYGFDIREGRITAEWLYYKEKRETYIFSKREDGFEVNSRFTDLTELVRRHLAGPKNFLLGTAVRLFPQGMRDILPHAFMRCLDRSRYHEFIIRKIPEDVLADLNTFLQQADPSFEQIIGDSGHVDNLTFRWKHQPEIPFGSLPLQFREETLILAELFYALRFHSVIILHGYWDLFHPLIRKAILTRFNNPRTNPLGSQLIVTTLSPYSISHDVSRRDQVWLIHSNREGTFQMYSLCDFRGSGRIWRRGRFPDYYLEGRTGAVPTME